MATLDGTSGTPVAIDGLWGLSFGNGAQGLDVNTLYFTAGISGPDEVESHGLFGSLAPVPEPASIALFAIGFAFVVFVTAKNFRFSSCQ